MSAQAPAPSFRLNFGEAFTFAFRDPHWPRKVTLAILCSLFGFAVIPAFLLAGYLLTLSERVMAVEPRPLPVWSGFGDLLRKGWRVFVVRVVYYLPIWLIALVMVGLVLAFIVALGGVGIFVGRPAPPSTSAAPFLLLLLIIPLSLLLIPFSLVLPCLTPAADAQLVLHAGQIEPAFRFGEVFAFIRRHLGQYLLAVVVYVGGVQAVSGIFSVGSQFGSFGLSSGGRPNAAFIAIFVGFLVAGWFVTTLATLYLRCALAHMLGQFCWHEREVQGHGR